MQRIILGTGVNEINPGERIQAAGIPTVWFNRPVSTNNEEAANLFLSNPASAFVGTNFEDAGRMQGELIGQYLVEHYNDIDLNGDGSVRHIKVVREPQNEPQTAQNAIDAVMRAAPFPDVTNLPKPWRFNETFLYDWALRFQLRALQP